MKNRFSRFLAGMLAALTVLCAAPAARAAGFADVPADSWAAEAIYRGVELGLFQGQSADRFGMGQPMTRAAFVTAMCRLFGWELVTPETPTFRDVQDADAWYYSAVETAYVHGAVTNQTDTFRPGDPITREELAVMLVRALGYGTIAGLAQDLPMPFKDVATGAGYLAMAYELGIVNGTSKTTFSPEKVATREQAAVMLMRVYDACHTNPGLVGVCSGDGTGDWSGYEAVALTGGRLTYGTAVQMARPAAEREQAFLEAVHAAGAKALLHVTASGSVLSHSAAQLAAAVADAAADGGYDGVYLDIPVSGEKQEAALTALAQALDGALGERSLYVAADAPAWGEGTSGALDYEALGRAADCLVVRVQAYEKEADGFVSAPLEPLEEVYYALSRLRTKVDKSRLCLLLTTTASAWEGGRERTMDGAEVETLLADHAHTQSYYAQRYACAYLVQQTSGSWPLTVWYLDEQSVRERTRMCAFLGVDRVCLSDTDAASSLFWKGLS